MTREDFTRNDIDPKNTILFFKLLIGTRPISKDKISIFHLTTRTPTPYMKRKQMTHNTV